MCKTMRQALTQIDAVVLPATRDPSGYIRTGLFTSCYFVLLMGAAIELLKYWDLLRVGCCRVGLNSAH
jgi:hypothetical protein